MSEEVRRIVGEPYCDRRGRYVGFYQDKKVEPGNPIYREYYEDCRPHGWAGLVSGRSKFVGGVCEVCGERVGNGVHHVDGKSNRWGNLIVVCRGCHSDIHSSD